MAKEEFGAIDTATLSVPMPRALYEALCTMALRRATTPERIVLELLVRNGQLRWQYAQESLRNWSQEF